MEQKYRFRGFVELIGIVAVVASLIFVGLEIRQNATATRGATQQQLAASAREITMAGAENLVRLTVNWVENVLLTEKYEEEMPEQ